MCTWCNKENTQNQVCKDCYEKISFWAGRETDGL